MLRSYEELANAVVLQAVEDYSKAGKDIVKGKKLATSKAEQRRITRFIKSKWFTMLTEVRPELLLKQLQKEEY